jgi:hypothetical protein
MADGKAGFDSAVLAALVRHYKITRKKGEKSDEFFALLSRLKRGRKVTNSADSRKTKITAIAAVSGSDTRSRE